MNKDKSAMTAAAAAAVDNVASNVDFVQSQWVSLSWFTRAVCQAYNIEELRSQRQREPPLLVTQT